ncbi:hypothetical protein CVT25_004094 [Psilocybe cyanescens]|uniref:Uncharacterized protein n=1 Tax=Psilocybe cyanescens TaxID=93625 RepID=A0A409X975_PSICY|nr:hypothetical protein CVT25_004094 [Psilocybe cyanescens]
MSEVEKFDDRDPNASYVGSDWNRGGIGEEYLQTTTWVRNATDAPTATFKFNGRYLFTWLHFQGCRWIYAKDDIDIGTSVSVFGTLDSADKMRGIPISSYSVDNEAPIVYMGPIPDVFQYKQLFFQSNTLSPGSHTLLITVLSNASYYVDFFTVAPNPAIVPISRSSSSFISSSSSSYPTLQSAHSSSFLFSSSSSSFSLFLTSSSSLASAATQTFSSSSSSSSAAEVPGVLQSSHSSGISRVGAAIGGALGGLAVLILVVIAVMISVRKDRWRARKNQLPLSELPNQNQNKSQNPGPHIQSLWVKVPPSTSQISPFITSNLQYGPTSGASPRETTGNPIALNTPPMRNDFVPTSKLRLP